MKKITILLIIGILLITGCVVEQTKQEKNAKILTCEDLAKNLDNFPKESNFCVKRLEANIHSPIWVGGTLKQVSEGTYNRAYERYEFELIFQGFEKQRTIHISTKQNFIPYKAGQFYKFDLENECRLMLSMASSGMFADPELNELEPLSCQTENI